MFLVADLLDRLRRLWRSSSLRLALLLSLIFAMAMAAAIFVALDLSRDAVLDRVDQTLEGLAATTELDDDRADSAGLIIRYIDDISDLPRVFARQVDRGGGTVSLNGNVIGSDTWRVFVGEDVEGEEVMIAVPIEDSFDALETVGGVLWATVVLVIAVTLIIGLGAGLLAQRRVARISGTLAQLAAGDLQARTGQTGPGDDMHDIGRQLDQTATALERLVTQTRHLSASIAHDLRTPLARLHARLESLPDGEPRSAALEEATRLSGIFDTIMRVARIEAAQGQSGLKPVDLGELATELAETFGPVVEDADKVLVCDVTAPATVQADQQMLVQALANLIQNALVHGGPTVTLFAQGHNIGVADDGPGVPPDQYGEIIKPMVRLDAARVTEGTGLGLALARAVADRHAAKLILSKNDPQGLRVTLSLTEL